MNTAFRLPDLGEGVHEAEILAVHVVDGQPVREGDLLLEVETDKAAVEIPSPITGTIRTVDVRKGDIARVGQVLVSFDTAAAVGQPSATAEPAGNSRTTSQTPGRSTGPGLAGNATPGPGTRGRPADTHSHRLRRSRHR